MELCQKHSWDKLWLCGNVTTSKKWNGATGGEVKQKCLESFSVKKWVSSRSIHQNRCTRAEYYLEWLNPRAAKKKNRTKKKKEGEAKSNWAEFCHISRSWRRPDVHTSASKTDQVGLQVHTTHWLRRFLVLSSECEGGGLQKHCVSASTSGAFL